MATDWTALKLEYVNSAVTLRELADKHGIKAAGVMRRAAKEGWEAERKQESAKVSKASQTAVSFDRIEQLAKFNEDDLKVAKAIRAKAAGLMGQVESPNDVRSLASAFEAAQRIGRLALGASTDNKELTGKDGKDLVPQSGVLMVPAAIDAQSWEEAVAKQQAELASRK